MTYRYLVDANLAQVNCSYFLFATAALASTVSWPNSMPMSAVRAQMLSECFDEDMPVAKKPPALYRNVYDGTVLLELGTTVVKARVS